MTTDIEAVKHVVAEYQQHQNDTAAFLALHTEDTVVVNIMGRRVLGREQLTQAMNTALATPLAKVRTTLDIEDVRFPQPGVAIVSAVKNVYDERDDHDGLPTSGTFTMVLVADDGTWKVALAQTTPRPAA